MSINLPYVEGTSNCEKNEIMKHCWEANYNFSWDQKKKKNENHSYNYHVKRSPHYYCQDLSEYWLDKIRKVFSG